VGANHIIEQVAELKYSGWWFDY